MSKVRTFFISIIIPLGLGIIISLILMNSFNYDELIKPELAPPAILFPIVWTILYVLMGVSYGLLETKNINTDETKQIYYLQLFLNLIWPIFFFGLEQRGVALIIIIFLLVSVIKMIIEFYKKDKVAGLLQIPYALWLVFATYLNYSAYVLNK